MPQSYWINPPPTVAKYSQCGTADVHAAFERSELLLGQQIEHLVIGVYHEAHMILVVVDPYFMPLAAVEPAVRVNDQLAGGARAEGEGERELVIAGQGHHERGIVGADRWLEQQDGLLAGGAEREGNVALTPTGHLDIRLRRGKGDHVLLRICRAGKEESLTDSQTVRAVNISKHMI